MQRLEVSVAVRLLLGSLGVKGLRIKGLKNTETGSYTGSNNSVLGATHSRVPAMYVNSCPVTDSYMCRTLRTIFPREK